MKAMIKVKKATKQQCKNAAKKMKAEAEKLKERIDNARIEPEIKEK